jgi:uncharacterized protein (DUF305 family)
MTRPGFCRIAVAFTLAMWLGPASAQQSMPGMSMPPAASDNPSSRAYAAGMQKMHEDMAIAPTGDADIDFARGMIPHHEGAIEMARVQLKYGKDPELHKLAEEIIAAQEKEIAYLQQWLAQHGH